MYEDLKKKVYLLGISISYGVMKEDPKYTIYNVLLYETFVFI